MSRIRCSRSSTSRSSLARPMTTRLSVVAGRSASAGSRVCEVPRVAIRTRSDTTPRVVDTRTRRPRRPAPRRVADQQRLAAVLTSSTAPVVPMTVSRITTPCTIRRTSACCGTRCVACCGRRGGRTGHYAVGGWRQWRHLSREVKKLFNKVRSTRRAQRHPERVEAYVARCRALVERAETTLDALDFSPGPGRVERRRRGYRPWVGPVASFRATPQSHRPYPVSCERSSNRASRFPAHGSRTGFTSTHATGPHDAPRPDGTGRRGRRPVPP